MKDQSTDNITQVKYKLVKIVWDGHSDLNKYYFYTEVTVTEMDTKKQDIGRTVVLLATTLNRRDFLLYTKLNEVWILNKNRKQVQLKRLENKTNL